MTAAVQQASPYRNRGGPQPQTVQLEREVKVQRLVEMLQVSPNVALRALQQTNGNVEEATARILDGQTPANDRSTANGSTERSTDRNSGSRRKPDRLIVGLIIGLFLVGSIALGLLQYQHDEEMKKVGEKPRIFDDYFVGKFDGTIILKSTETLEPGEYASSPSGKYRVGLTMDGDFVLEEVVYDTPTIAMVNDTGVGLNETTVGQNETIGLNETWIGNEMSPKRGAPDTTTTGNSGSVFDTVAEDNILDERTILETTTIWSAGTRGAAEVYMQGDGNLVIKSATGASVWSSGSHRHNDATLIVDDGGRVGVRFKESLVWMQGLPQGTYRGPSSEDLTFPVRGTFYYAWYPQTWKVSSGAVARFEPDLGYYVSGDPDVVDSHIDQLEYGNFDVGIISWFGPSTNLDIARITNLMDRTLELNANVKWAIYYEDEWKLDPDQTQLKEDYEYIKKYFAWHPTYAHVDGKPLIYIWNENDCEVVDRWMEASNGEWFVIPKLFGGWRDCPVQPNNWHQYGPASAYARFNGHSVSISPGFWHAGEATARLPRLSETAWCDNVRRMVDSGEPWQLVTTFNEQGEGTGIESTAAHWPSESGYGYYLDCLHIIP
ncbi:MAG: hypothetical protein SGBAC_003980 [Bacillariaceae sp.]